MIGERRRRGEKQERRDDYRDRPAVSAPCPLGSSPHETYIGYPASDLRWCSGDCSYRHRSPPVTRRTAVTPWRPNSAVVEAGFVQPDQRPLPRRRCPLDRGVGQVVHPVGRPDSLGKVASSVVHLEEEPTGVAFETR